MYSTMCITARPLACYNGQYACVDTGGGLDDQDPRNTKKHFDQFDGNEDDLCRLDHMSLSLSFNLMQGLIMDDIIPPSPDSPDCLAHFLDQLDRSPYFLHSKQTASDYGSQALNCCAQSSSTERNVRLP